MKKFSVLIPTLFFLLSGYGCKEVNQTREADFIISGKLENGAQLAMFFEELTPADIIPVDSIYTDNEGRFEYTLFLEDAGFYRLGITPGNFITLAVEPGDKILIKAKAHNLADTYTLSGSSGSQILWNINRHKSRGMEHADSLRMLYRESRGTPRFTEMRDSLRAEYRTIKADQRQYIIRVIEQNPNNLASILALYQYFEDHILLKEDEHFEYFEMLSKSLCNTYPSNKHVIDLKKRVNDYKRNEQQRILNEKNLAIGNTAPEIILPDPQGQPLSLSSLRGNVVLIDFWAAWCPPCRTANITLGELYKKYQKRGFEIYGVSLDRTAEQWHAAIEADNITWPQVSDLRFMNSPVVNLYNIAEIPHTVLIDREGRIIARNFNVDELESMLLENL